MATNGIDPQDYLAQISNMTMGRADFKPELFDRLIMQKGFRVIWEQAIFCSCITLDTGQPNYNCPVCKGKGYVYILPKDTRVVVTSIGGKKEQEKSGLDEKGSAYLTPMSIDNIGYRDKITFLDFIMKYSEVIEKFTDDETPVKYPIISVIQVRYYDLVLEENVDFVVSEDRKSIVWLNTKIPTDAKFSMLYTTRPVYIAIFPIHELRGTQIMTNGGGLDYFINLPKQYQIKREDFIDVSLL